MKSLLKKSLLEIARRAGAPEALDRLARHMPGLDGGAQGGPGGWTWPKMPEAVSDTLDRLARGELPIPNVARPAPDRAAPRPDGARFLSETFEGESGHHPYKLYVPSGYMGQPVPLVVMLHGCLQSPDDFAAGTRMNEAAEAETCLVLYPGQIASANSSRCWNWFNASEQRRGAGEPAMVAGLVRRVMATYAVDPRRVYVAGLSAGGAAASVLAATYPDVFAAVGVHSGLACGAARDMASAMMAMRTGATGPRHDSAVPVIVFHGDRDTTVHPRNGDAVTAQATPAGTTRVTSESGSVAGGHSYTRALHRDASGRIAVEHWVIHGAGHAWSGGSTAGSYTDPLGPDATGQMLRFFLEHPAPR